MNIGERIALLQEELKFEDERQEVLYAEFHGLCDPWPDNLEKVLSSDERQELVTLNKARKREESEALARRPGFLTWKSGEETETNLGTLLRSLRETNNIVERIIKIMKKAKE
jgi:hypothetical protein